MSKGRDGAPSSLVYRVSRFHGRGTVNRARQTTLLIVLASVTLLAALQWAGWPDGRRVLDLQEGEVLDGKFIVSRIGYESVDIRFVGFPEAPARRVGVAKR